MFQLWPCTLTHYVIPLHITLTSSLSLTPHPHSFWHCCALFRYKVSPLCMYLTCSNLNLCNHCLLNVSVTSHLVLNSDLWTLALHLTLCSSHSGSLNLGLNSKHWTLAYCGLTQTLDFNYWPTQNTQTLIVGRHSAQAEANVQTPLNLSPK